MSRTHTRYTNKNQHFSFDKNFQQQYQALPQDSPMINSSHNNSKMKIQNRTLKVKPIVQDNHININMNGDIQGYQYDVIEITEQSNLYHFQNQEYDSDDANIEDFDHETNQQVIPQESQDRYLQTQVTQSVSVIQMTSNNNERINLLQDNSQTLSPNTPTILHFPPQIRNMTPNQREENRQKKHNFNNDQKSLHTDFSKEQLENAFTFDNLIKQDFLEQPRMYRDQSANQLPSEKKLRGEQLLDRLILTRQKVREQEKMFSPRKTFNQTQRNNKQSKNSSNSRSPSWHQRLYEESAIRQKQNEIIHAKLQIQGGQNKPKICQKSEKIVNNRRGKNQKSQEKLVVFDALYNESKARDQKQRLYKLINDENADKVFQNDQFQVSINSLNILEMKNKNRIRDILSEINQNILQRRDIIIVLQRLDLIILNNNNNQNSKKTIDNGTSQEIREETIIQLSKRFVEVFDYMIQIYKYYSKQQGADKRTIRKLLYILTSLQYKKKDKKQKILKILQNNQEQNIEQLKQIISDVVKTHLQIDKLKKTLRDQSPQRKSIRKNKSTDYLQKLQEKYSNNLIFTPEINRKSKLLDPVSKLTNIVNKIQEQEFKNDENQQLTTPQKLDTINENDDSIIPEDEDMSPVKSYFNDSIQKSNKNQRKQGSKSRSKSKTQINRFEILYEQAKIKESQKQQFKYQKLDNAQKQQLREQRLLEAGKSVLIQKYKNSILKDKYQNKMTEEFQNSSSKQQQSKTIPTSTSDDQSFSQSARISQNQNQQHRIEDRRLLYQIDIDVNMERKICLQLYDGDILEDKLLDIQKKHNISDHNISKIHSILKERIQQRQEQL